MTVIAGVRIPFASPELRLRRTQPVRDTGRLIRLFLEQVLATRDE